MPDFEIKFAANPKEVQAAQRLRFEIFNVEMKKGLASSYASGLDQDEYDPLCDHLLIIDKKKNLTIGTYRLLLRSRLGSQGSFYSESEFDISNIKKLKGEILEMGRSCVHKDYRRNAIVSLLWGGIVEYMKKHGVGYIIGCPSLYIMNTGELSGIYTLMKESYFSPKEFRVFPKNGKAVAHLRDCADIKGEEKKIFLKLPALIRSYLKVGAFVCGEPAVDHEFGSVDFFMLLDVKNASGPYLKRFRIQDMPTR